MIVLVAAWSCGLPGCAAGTASQSMTPTAPTSQPASTEQIQQQGAANVAAQTDVQATGISIEQTLPWGLLPLLALIAWLSHRRELKRIGRNGAKQC